MKNTEFCRMITETNGVIFITLPDGTKLPGQVKTVIEQGCNDKTDTIAPLAKVTLTLLIYTGE